MNDLFLKSPKKGQITLIALLLGILGLTVGLSVASRSLTDLKQASYVDFGTKALAAAEAGAEYGFNQLSLGNINCGASPLPDLVLPNATGPLGPLRQLQIQTVTYEICPGVGYVREDVGQDEVVEVDSTGFGAGGNFRVFWDGSAGKAKAVEVVVIYSTDYSINRYAFNSSGNAIANSNFSASDTTLSFPAGCPSDTIFNNQVPMGVIPSGKGGREALLVRVKPLGGPSTIQICGNGSGLSPQTYDVTATATTTNNTVRRVLVTKKNFGSLPGVFDNVIFSGGDLRK